MSGAEAVRTRGGSGARGAIGSGWRRREREERVKRRSPNFRPSAAASKSRRIRDQMMTLTFVPWQHFM